MSRNFDEYARTKLEFFKRGTAVYYDRRVVSLEFDKYTRTQKEITRVAKEIVNIMPEGVENNGQWKNHKTTLFMGDASMPAHIKRHLRSPGPKKLTRYLEQQPGVRVIETDEFRTTKLCSWCYKELEKVKSSKDR